MALKYHPFAACVAMEQAARSAPPLRQGSRGPAVALLQGALFELQEKLPLSTRKSGALDGIFGAETRKAVLSFQAKAKLKPDGVAGKMTIRVLDAEMVKKAKAGPPVAPPLSVLPSTPQYECGTGDPPMGHDPGAGAWKSKPAEMTYVALRKAVIDALPIASSAIGDNAAKHMAHYLGNSGKDYTIDLEGMVREVPSASRYYEDEVAQALELVERLPPGRHLIRSRKVERGSNRQSENRNWFFAIGMYVRWGQGVAIVKDTPGGHECELEFEYEFYDRYNWDAGKAVTFAGITVTDAFMGEFHRQGLAKEFDCRGSLKRRFTWKRGVAPPAEQIYPAGGSSGDLGATRVRTLRAQR